MNQPTQVLGRSATLANFRTAFMTLVFGFSAVAFLQGVAMAEVPGLSPGPVEIQSIGPMAFADRGVLLVGDPKAATIFAIDVKDGLPGGHSNASSDFQAIDDIRAAVADALHSDSATLGDLVTDPQNGHVILSAESKGTVHLLSVNADGTLTRINLDKISHAKKDLPHPPEDRVVGQGRRKRNRRMESITDLAFFDGRVLVSGLSATESPSSVREFSFPFAENTIVTNVEIYHAAHGRVEEPAIRTFLPMTIAGQPTLLAGFTCTPLVRFPIGEMKGDKTVRGTTVAELGNWNKPLDLISYTKDGREHLLMSNTARGLMKISTENIESAPGLEDKVSGGGTAGQPFEKVEGLDGVVQMDKLNDSQAVVIMGSPDQVQSLAVIDLP
ncbi:MAG: hypothetical protein AAF989_04050 [Planctomycetota bacterium]